MAENFDIKNIKNNYPEILKVIPEEIIDLASSEETQNSVADMCTENSIEKEGDVEKIAYYIGLSLLGELPLDELSKKLESKIGLDREVAEKIATEANQLIFEKVRTSLDDLYKNYERLDPEIEAEIDQFVEEQEETKESTREDQIPSKDTYREPVE